MATAVTICNTAIARIGQRDFISSLDEDSAAARACNVLYESQLEAMLASFEWSFATKRATLALVSSGTREDWGYVYALPADAVEVRSVWPGSRRPTLNQTVEFEFELSVAGTTNVILSDMEGAVVSYTRRFDTSSVLPALFADALTWRLARELSMTLANKPDYAVRAHQAYEIAFELAKADDLNLGHQADAEPESISVRR